MLAKYSAAPGARVVWISSHEASSEFYDPKDWQLIKSEHSYQCSKYQMNMLSLYLDREAVRGQLDDTPAIRHFISYPGVAGTNIATAMLGTFTSLCMFATFYIVSSSKHPEVHSLNGYLARQDSWVLLIIPLTSSRRPYPQSMCRSLALHAYPALVELRARRIQRRLFNQVLSTFQRQIGGDVSMSARPDLINLQKRKPRQKSCWTTAIVF